jgi:hypothetical protein
MGRSTTRLFCFMLCVGLPLLARAEGRPSLLADHRPGAANTSLELELGWFMRSSGGASLQMFAPHIDVGHTFSEHVELAVDWPIAFGFIKAPGSGTDGRIISGNPNAVLYYVDRKHDGFFRIGGGIGLPLAPDLFGLTALAMNGLRDAWDFWPKTLSLIVPGALQVQHGALVLGADFAAAVMIPTNGADTDLALQVAGLIGAKVDKTTLGARLQAAWLPTADGDWAQVAIVPFAQADFADGGFLYARFTLNIDPPFGLANHFSAGRVWGLFIGGGSRL